MKKELTHDNFFLGITIILVIVGMFSFVSASLGILARNESVFYNVLFSQLVLGLVGGGIALYVCMRIPYKFWRKYSFYFFIFSLVLTALVFVPGLSLSHGGASRWISIGPVTFQPAEFLKFAFVLYFAGWLSWIYKKKKDVTSAIVPFVAMMGIAAFLLLRQPDTKSLVLIFIAALGMLFVAGIKWKYIIAVCLIGLVALGALVAFRPYVAERFKTFMNPNHDPRGSSYQLRQALIAIGSGGTFGRGLGQSIQKFNYLPEPQGDSIFAIIGEEFGFMGSVIVIVLFVMFALRGFRIATRAPDTFSSLLVFGIITLLTAQSFLNIASIIGVIPLTGVPLVFMSHGGTSLMISLAAVGIVLNVSKHQKNPQVKLRDARE